MTTRYIFKILSRTLQITVWSLFMLIATMSVWEAEALAETGSIEYSVDWISNFKGPDGSKTEAIVITIEECKTVFLIEPRYADSLHNDREGLKKMVSISMERARLSCTGDKHIVYRGRL